MPPDKIDGSPIAEVVEGVLQKDLPAMVAHDRGDGVDERRMLPVEQPRKLAAAPERLDRHANLKDVTDRTEARDRQALELAGLRQRHQLLADAGTRRDIQLSPPKSAPDRAKDQADPLFIHRRIVRRRAHPRLTGALRSANE